MASKGRPLSELAELVGARTRGPEATVVDVTNDSRKVGPGCLYVALRGANVDGHDFVDSAIEGGAAAVCVDHETGAGVPELIVDDTRAVLGELAASVHDYPSTAMKVIGVTGTNGKTTVTHFIDSIAVHAGLVTGLVGTIHTRIAGESIPAEMTTPEASEFQRLLARMRDRGVSLVAAEVSSHALEFGRVRATQFAVAAFTNLSQDHLDFHGDMESYRRAKERLFTEYEVGTAVFNIDDPVGAELAQAYDGRAVTVGKGGDVSFHHVESAGSGRTSVHMETPWGSIRQVVPVFGSFNLSNLATAAACCLAADVDFESVASALGEIAGVPGRFELVSGDDAIAVIVDYAHTPEAVARSVEVARDIASGRVIALLGAGGDRDRAKRPAMGEALATADLAIVTSDNPRSEDPEAIVASVLSGMDPGRPHLVEVDRRLAIDRAVGEARDGDVVLVLGRGHEPYQQIGAERIPFDDRVVAADTLARMRKSAEYGSESGSMDS